MVIRSALVSDIDAVRECARDAYARYVDTIGREPAPMVADFAGQIAEGAVHVAVDDDDAALGFIVFFARPDHMFLKTSRFAGRLQAMASARR